MQQRYILFISVVVNFCLILVQLTMRNGPPHPTELFGPVRLNDILLQHTEKLQQIHDLLIDSTKTREKVVVPSPSPCVCSGGTSLSVNTPSKPERTKPLPPAAVSSIIDFNCGQYALGSECFRNLPRNYSYWHFSNGHNEFPDVCSIMNCIDEMGHLFGMHSPSKKLNAGNSVVGMLAFSIADFALFDFVLSQHQNLVNFTEFGTASGITSLYIGMVAKIRGGSLITFDFRNTRCKESLQGWMPEVMTFQLADLLTSSNPDAVNALRRSPQVVFMDNGNKPLEINMYARYLDVGSIIITHDFGGEWKMPQIQEELDARGYIPIYEDYAYKLGSVARAFYRLTAGKGVVTELEG